MLVALLAGFGLGLVASWARDRLSEHEPERIVLGPVVEVTEATTGLRFRARVDSGAALSSIHCPASAITIEDAADDPADNVGKIARIELVGDDGSTGIVEARIQGYPGVRHPGLRENRYEIRLTIRVAGVQRETVVLLNDRSMMRYNFLIGRELLADGFVVDVNDNPDEP